MSINVSELHAQKASPPSRFAKAINDPNLITAVMFFVVGLVIVAVAMLRFPDLGAIIAQSNQF